MAATFNAFTALVGSQDALAASSKKKKKNNASKPKGTDQQPQASKPVVSEVAAPVVPDGPAMVPVSEAIAITEKTARTYKSGADRIKLWKDWIKQGTDKGTQVVKYKELNGSLIEFKKMYLRSKALEITVESCISSPLPRQNEGHLQQLLATFLPTGEASAASLANAIVRLAELLSDDAPDTVGAAQRAVFAVIGSLKSGAAAHTGEVSHVSKWVHSVSDKSKDIANQQTTLQKLAQTSGGIITKEQTACAIRIVRLQAEKFDLLQPSSLPKAGSSTGSSPSVKNLNELKSVITSHLKAAEAQGGSSRGGGNSSSAAYQREEQLLVQQAHELASQIKTLEAQLAALRAQAQEVQDRRAQIQHRQRSTFESVGKGKGAAVAASLPASHYKEELAAANLLASLVDPSAGGSSAEDVAQLVASQANVAVDYIMTAQQYLTMSLNQLAEIPQRVNFSKQRVAQAEKLLKLSSSSEKAIKQKQEAERLLEEAVGASDEILVSSREVVNSVRSRYDQLRRTSPEQASALAKHIHGMDEVAAAIQSQYMSVQAVMQPQLAAPAAPAAPAPLAYTAPLGNGTLAAAPVPASAPFSQTIPAAGMTRPSPRSPVPAAVPAPVGKPAPIAKPNAKPTPTPVPAATADKVVAPPKPAGAQAAPAAPARQWAKVQVAPVEPAGDGDSAPTPAEAFMPAGTSADGFKVAGASKKNRRKA